MPGEVEVLETHVDMEDNLKEVKPPHDQAFYMVLGPDLYPHQDTHLIQEDHKVLEVAEHPHQAPRRRSPPLPNPGGPQGPGGGGGGPPPGPPSIGPRGDPPGPPGGLGNNPPNPPGPGGNPGGGGGGGGGGSGRGGGPGPAPVPHRQPRQNRQPQPQPAAPNPLHRADPAMVTILDRLIATEERKQEDAEQFHKASQKFTMFPTSKFDGTEPSKAYDHWTDFMRYYRYTTDNNVLHCDNYDDFKTVFELSLSGIAITWFRGMKDKFQTIAQFKAAFLGRFNRWGQTQKQLTNAWHTLRFDMQKEDFNAFTLDVRLLGDIMHMTPEQTLDKFKDSFDSEISAHLLKANDIEAATAKVQQLIYLYRNNYMPTSACTVLLHEHVEPRTILEHQLAERDTTTQVLNSHTVDDKYNDNDSTVHPETKS